MIPTTDQDKLKALIERRHPEYDRHAAHWEFCEATYEGGRDWFYCGNIFRYLKEGDREHKDRLERAYRFNHTKEIVDLVNKYIFKGKIVRNEEDAPDEIKQFWKLATRDGKPIDALMRYASTKSSVYGRPYMVIDTNKTGDVLTVADEKSAGARVYAYMVRPQDVLDVSFDSAGNIQWILIREPYRDDANPLSEDTGVGYQYRLWMTDSWQLFRIRKKAGSETETEVYEAGNGIHNLGLVPVIPIDHADSESPWVCPSLIGDIAYLDRAVANYLSNMDAIIQDQTFSQLVIPAQALKPGENGGMAALVEMGTKRIFTYDSEGGKGPEYISPDVKQAQLIMAIVEKIISEIYHSVGMAGERTKQDNSMGIDNSSGVAKAYDFERMNALLVSKAEALSRAENKVNKIVMAWHGRPEPDDALVSYPESFDVRGIYDEFEIASQLDLLQAPDTVRREQMMLVVEKVFPQIAKALRAKIESEMKEWPPEEPDLTQGGLSNPAGGSKPSIKPAKDNKQGQVVK